MTNEPFIAHSELTNEVYIVLGRNKYRVTEQAIHAVKAIKALAQEPILDKIRNQIKSNLRGVEIALEVLAENDPLRPKMEGAKDTLEDCLEIIDKYKGESEGKRKVRDME
jgi:hypothetical protein